MKDNDDPIKYRDPKFAAECLVVYREVERLKGRLRAIMDEDPFVGDLFNPTLTFDVVQWPRDASGDCVCPSCAGKGGLTAPAYDSLDDHTMPCFDCRATGKLSMYFVMKLRGERQDSARHLNQVERLRDFIRRSSTCKTCGGNPMKTMGGLECKECGLEGECPWAVEQSCHRAVFCHCDTSSRSLQARTF